MSSQLVDVFANTYNIIVFNFLQTMLDSYRPHVTEPSVSEIDCAHLVARGIQGVMLDLDNTLAPWRSPAIFPGVEAWMQCVKAHGVRACILTNASNAGRVRPIADALDIPWVIRALKPFAGGYRRGMAMLETLPHATAMVGDMLLTDILGANRLGIYTILVDPKSAREALPARLFQRPLEQLIGRQPRRASR
jgi:HAD superfamily phosphatase (TIGR01668 family)